MNRTNNSVSLALCGDVMTGRGVDQILPYPVEPTLYEGYVRDARDYVALAEAAHGSILLPVDFTYVWGDALDDLRRVDALIVNLETSITSQDEPWPDKRVHYRMDPRNVGCLSAAQIDCCSVANNHVLDWGYAGLQETLSSLDRAGIAYAGAGRSTEQAIAPAVLDLADGKGRVLVVAFGRPTSGVFESWAATGDKPGVNFLEELSPETAARIAQKLQRHAQPDDITVVSLHWGGNWGYEIPRRQIDFARRLVDAGVHVVHGHSSHHAKAVELRGRGVILYGCGDFLTDYEGISGHEKYRGDLSVLYRATFSGRPRALAKLELVPFQMRRMRLRRAVEADVRWLDRMFDRISAELGTEVVAQPDLTLIARQR